MDSFAKNIEIQQLSKLFTYEKVEAFVLRLDKIHNIVSGNKWFKLQYYLQEATLKNCNTILTFGGAYSNHIVATAFACKQAKLRSVGIIRGETPKKLSHTLIAATDYGMEILFTDRINYKNKKIPNIYKNESVYVINEGGYGKLGCKGTATIYDAFNLSSFNHIICACGTGTTIAGIIQKALPHQKITGINVLKGYENLVNDIESLLDKKPNKNFNMNNEYHFGGYAKHNTTLIDFMNELWLQEQLPTDFVYTAKLFYAVKKMIEQNEFEQDEKLLLIHSGGLQGNLSLPNKTLVF